MRISAAIEHHPSRARLVAALAEKLAPFPVDVAVDPDPERPSPATWPTYRLALEQTPSDATHRLVVQDDAIPCADFADVVERAVRARPDRLLVLCVCQQPTEAAVSVRRAIHHGRTFAELDRLRWVPLVGAVWPVELARQVLEYAGRARWPADFLADDEVVYRAAVALGIVPLATVPSLVDHPGELPTVGGRRKPRRTAVAFAGDLAPALDFAAGHTVPFPVR